MKQWDVVIIGSGISSLTAASILSQKGKSVCVLEQYIKPGGYLHCFHRFGIQFDTGGHYVGAMEEGQPFRVLLEYLGVFDDSLFVPLDPEGFDVFQFPSFSISFPKGYTALAEALIQEFPEESSAIAQYLDLVQKTVTQFPTYTFNEDNDGALLMKALETPLSTVVEGLTSNPRLQSVLYTHCSIHGVWPQDISFGLHSLITDSMIRGPYGFRNGGDALAQKFVKKIEEFGGKVVTRAKVESLITQDKNITEIRLKSGEVLRADWVISGAHPKSTFRMVDADNLSPAFKSRLNKIKESIGIFGIYANCSEAPPFHSKKNYYFFGSEDPKRMFHSENAGDPPSVVFVTRPNRTENYQNGKFPLTFHSAGPATWFSEWAPTAYNKRPPAYHALKRQMADNVFRFMEDYTPGLKAVIKQYETSTTLTNEHFNGSEEGSAYGVYHSIENTGMRALGPRTHIKNLLLTGQSCLAPGLLGAAISGLRTAGSLIGIKPLIRELRLRTEGT